MSVRDMDMDRGTVSVLIRGIARVRVIDNFGLGLGVRLCFELGLVVWLGSWMEEV